MNIKEIISKLTLDEKLSLLTGKDKWATCEVERLNIPSIRVSDGPHGVRKEYKDERGETQTYEATIFPTASALGATFNKKLLHKVGKALGKECSHLDVDVLLGPGVNIKRTPICGRNFEYFSEDPYLAGELSAEYISGVQSEGVGTSLKHYAGNNQEYDRNSVSSEIDERTLREIYLKAFEIAVKKSQPWTVMCAYNRLNGIYCAENKKLLDYYLRKEFGFKGIVMSDWWAVHDRAKSLKATLELEMPYTDGSFDNLKKAYEAGEINDTDIDGALERLLNIVFKAYEARSKRDKNFDAKLQHQIAKEAALEGITLLKNEDNIFPINKNKVNKVTIIGQYAKEPNIGGGGSARAIAATNDSTYDRMTEILGADVKLEFFPGYSTWAPIPGVENLSFALDSAVEADMALVFVGNNDKIEGEAHDRETIKLSSQFENLILNVASRNPNTVVVIQAGSAIDMSAWIDKVKGVVFTWYAGEAGGSAAAEVICGLVNPSGKLAETFPLSLEDNPSYENYPGNGYAVPYREGILVGYRYYDTLNKEVLFPFGYGLSYTTFEYSDLVITKNKDGEEVKVDVRFKVKNTGAMEGKEAVQLYVSDISAHVLRPNKELKGFEKVSLKPGEEKEVSITLDSSAFSYYSTSLNKWHIESGNFKILVGASSRDIRLCGKVFVNGEENFS